MRVIRASFMYVRMYVEIVPFEGEEQMNVLQGKGKNECVFFLRGREGHRHPKLALYVYL